MFSSDVCVRVSVSVCGGMLSSLVAISNNDIIVSPAATLAARAANTIVMAINIRKERIFVNCSLLTNRCAKCNTMMLVYYRGVFSDCSRTVISLNVNTCLGLSPQHCRELARRSQGPPWLHGSDLMIL